MSDRDSELRDADERIEAAERAIAHQMNVLIVLRADGHPTEEAQKLLDVMRESLEILKRSRTIIELELQQERAREA